MNSDSFLVLQFPLEKFKPQIPAPKQKKQFGIVIERHSGFRVASCWILNGTLIRAIDKSVLSTPHWQAQIRYVVMKRCPAVTAGMYSAFVAYIWAILGRTS